MGLTLSQTLTKPPPKTNILPHYIQNNYLDKSYYYQNKDTELKNKLIEKEICKNNCNQINSTINFVLLLNEKDVVGQINKLREKTALDIDNLTVVHQEGNYLIKIPVKELDDVYVEIIF